MKTTTSAAARRPQATIRTARLGATPHGTLAVYDLENLAGTGVLEPDLVLVVQVLVDLVAPTGCECREVIAVSHPANAVAAFFTWQGSARCVGRWGHDGADLALLDELADVDFIRRRYDKVIVGSGDHVFAPSITALKSAGVTVTVVAPRGSTSAAVQTAAGGAIRYIESPARRPHHYAQAA